MAGIRKEPGPTAQRVAANIRRIRRGRDLAAVKLSERLEGIGYPIADTGITKTEQGTRRVDVDDLVPLALALGVTPNVLLLPEVSYLDSPETYQLTPAVSGNAERLWQWAQGERPLPLPLPDLPSPLDPDRALDFTVRSRPYLTAPRAPGAGRGESESELRQLSVAIQRAMKAGATGTEIRRVTELTLTLPSVMTDDQIDLFLEHGKRPAKEES